MDVVINGSITGGTPKVLTHAGTTGNPSGGGKAIFVTDAHSRLAPREISMFVTPPRRSKTDPGVARTGLKIAMANVATSEECCSTVPGTVIIDLDIRWPLSQPQSVLDDALAYLQAVVFEPGFIIASQRGILPNN